MPFLGSVAGYNNCIAMTDTEAEDIAFLPLAAASERIRQREISPRELTRLCLERIARLDPVLNSFITVTAESAMAQAAQLEAELAAGAWRGPLHGIPIAVKDNMDMAGARTTAGSAVFIGLPEEYPGEDATAVARLRAAGAVLLGKLNMHEFAFGTTSLVSHFGPVRNPWNLERIAGGSSGGSAAAVAAGLCYGAVGTDTGGSIRLPAACCGIVGLKPTYGRVSAQGVVPLSWTLDHVGPMCRTTQDAALMLNAMAGYDPRDTASDPLLSPEDFAATLGRDTDGTRVGVLRAFALTSEIAPVFEAALGTLRTLGCALSDRNEGISGADVYGDVLLPEMWAYHAPLFAAYAERYAPETRRRMEVAEDSLASEYVLARRTLETARRTLASIFSDADLLVLPTAPFAAPRAADCASPIALPLAFTNPFNVLGVPAVSVPCGFTAGGMPVGLQIVGPRGGEAAVLALAHAYEQATGWHTRRPPLSA